MGFLIVKAFMTAGVVVAVSEIAKRSTLFGAILVSLPLTSILAMFWLYMDTKETKSIENLSTSIFWMVLPSSFFFIAFPILLKAGVRFFPALIAACVTMSGVYWVYVVLLRRFGIHL